MTSAKKKEVKVDRRTKSTDRRQNEMPVARDRRKVQRRRQIDPTTCERDYTDEEIEFMHALDAYKRAAGRMFPTCSEILEVVRDMGYVRVSADAPAASGDTPGDIATPEITSSDLAQSHDNLVTSG